MESLSVPLLTPAEVAARCRLSTKTVLRAIHSGRLRACRLGARGGYRVRAVDVEAWLEASVVQPSATSSAQVPAEGVLPGRLVVPEVLPARR